MLCEGYADGYMVAEMSAYIEYPLHPCPLCGDEISNIYLSGLRMTQSQYSRAPCRKPSCKKIRLAETKSAKAKEYRKYRPHPNYRNTDFLIGVRT